MKKIKYGILSAIFAAIGCLYFGFADSVQETATAQTKPEAKFALLIGINEYDDNGISDLSGTENDVVLMRDMLIDVYKFNKDKDIRELVSSKTSKTQKPTKKNIEAAFREHLIKNAEEFKKKNPNSDGATIIFYYSGHGSFVPDQETEKDGKDEYFDGYDETIVPMDAVKSKEDTDIRDDDLNAWFKELKKHTSNITFVFDSCHSGTVTRGANNKSIKGREFAKKPQTRGDKQLNETMDKEEGYVTISGSMPNELSQEDVMPILPKAGENANEKNPAQQWNGYLTYYLVKELRENRGVSINELMRSVSTAVNKKNKEQTPQVEGDIQRQFLGTKESRQKRSIPIQKIEKKSDKTIVTIGAGKIVGALPGGVVGFYKESAALPSGDTDRIEVGKIIKSLNFTSEVEVTSADVTTKSKAVLATPFFTDQKRKVAVDTSGTDAAAQKLKNLITLLSNDAFFEPLEASVKVAANELKVEVAPKDETGTVRTDEDKNWSVAIVRGTYSQFKEGYTKSTKSKTAIKDTDEVFYLATPNGNPIYHFWVKADETDAESKIREALVKYTRVENILSLENAVSNMTGQIELKLVRFKSYKRTDEGCESEAYTEAELKKFEDENAPIYPGEWFYFEIINKTNQPLYPYLYNISTDGAIKLGYEPSADSEILRSGQTLPLFNAKNCSGITIFQAEEPFGKETFKVIAASKRFDGTILQSEAITATKRSGLSALENLFAQASTNTRSNQTGVPFSGWSTSKIEFWVTPKK